MLLSLPVPIDFTLPEGWREAPPEVAEPDAAYCAVHRGSAGEPSASITISGELRPDAAPLAEIADEAAERLRGRYTAGQIAERREIGTAAAPGLLQVLRLLADVDGVQERVMRAEVLLSVYDQHDSRQRAVLLIALTTNPELYEQRLVDLQRLLETIRPLEPGAHQA